MQFDPILFDWESSALSLNLFRCTAQGLVEIFMKSLATFAADTEMKDRVFIANPQHHSWTSIQAEEGHFFSCQTELFASRMSTGAHSASLTSLSSWYYIHSNHVFATSHNKHIYNIFTQVAWKPVPFLSIWQICETRIRAGCTGRCNILYTCSVISAHPRSPKSTSQICKEKNIELWKHAFRRGFLQKIVRIFEIFRKGWGLVDWW